MSGQDFVGAQGDMERVLRALGKEIEDATKKREDILASINDAKITKEELDRSIGTLQKTVEGLEGSIHRLTDIKTANETTIEGFHQEKNRLVKEVTDLEKSIQDLKKEQITVRNGVEEEVKSAQKQVQDKIATETVELTSLKTERDALEGSIEAMEKHLASINDAIEVATKKHDELKNDGKALTSFIAKTEKDKGAVVQQLEQTRIDLETTRTALKTVQDEVSILQSEKEALTPLCDEKRQEIATIDANIAKKKEEYQNAVARIVNISKREKYVQEQEAYIREVFQDAGLDYVPWVPDVTND